MSRHIRIAVALDGVGWHPAAWRDDESGARDLTSLSHWRRVIGQAERGGVDFVTLEDSFVVPGTPLGAQELGPGATVPEPVRARLDALLVAAAVAPSTSRIGLVPTVTTTHTEPFHVATSLQTLDHVSRGRAGWRLQASPTAVESRLFGRREVPELSVAELLDPANAAVIADLFDEAADVAEVVRRLWDSWEDDAVIRDVATGRFLDRDRIHGAEFEGRWFSVKGASIVPRSPQGQPPVTVLAHRVEPFELAAKAADVVYVTPTDDADAARILAEVRAAEQRVGRPGESLAVYADLLVLLEDTAIGARAALDRLDGRAAAPLVSDAFVEATTVTALVERLASWSELGYAGFRLRPARIPADLAAITDRLMPALVRAGLHAPIDGAPSSLRAALGLTDAPNRFSTKESAA